MKTIVIAGLSALLFLSSADSFAARKINKSKKKQAHSTRQSKKQKKSVKEVRTTSEEEDATPVY